MCELKWKQRCLLSLLPDPISNSPKRLLYHAYDVSSENLVLDQLIITSLTFFFILNTCLLETVQLFIFWSLTGVTGLTFHSHEWPRYNFSSQYQYNINQISDEKKEKYQFGDNHLIQYSILWTSIIRIVWLAVRRMKHLTWELKG